MGQRRLRVHCFDGEYNWDRYLCLRCGIRFLRSEMFRIDSLLSGVVYKDSLYPTSPGYLLKGWKLKDDGEKIAAKGQREKKEKKKQPREKKAQELERYVERELRLHPKID